jgi:glutamate-1-semialdehyde 2,1-aminomutase
VEKVRLTNSGTEAVMTAIRLARGATGRNKIIKFIGCYHGHVDYLLVKAGSGAMTTGVPSSPGVPKDFTRHTIALPYNNVEAVEKAFDRYSGKIAAVIVEPVAGNMGVVAGERTFLTRLRKLCTKHRSVLIFDEVISGFRLGYGGVQKTVGVEADLTCLGKVIGGGFPIGACGGRAAIMDCLSPAGRVYQAGTLAGNPVCTAAGIETLKILKSLKPYTALERATRGLCEGIAGTLEEKGIEYTINRVGSMFTVFFARGAVTDYVGALKADTNRYAQCFRGLLAAGIYLPPSQFEACFLSTEHKERDIAATLEALRRLNF